MLWWLVRRLASLLFKQDRQYMIVTSCFDTLCHNRCYHRRSTSSRTHSTTNFQSRGLMQTRASIFSNCHTPVEDPVVRTQSVKITARAPLPIHRHISIKYCREFSPLWNGSLDGLPRNVVVVQKRRRCSDCGTIGDKHAFQLSWVVGKEWSWLSHANVS